MEKFYFKCTTGVKRKKKEQARKKVGGKKNLMKRNH